MSQVAADLHRRYGPEVSSLTVMFPSRRAGLFFGEALASLIDRPAWQPADLSIDSLAQELSGLVVGERLRLVAELFRVYSEFHPSETFDGFYFWGELLLGDFDSIDKYLIDADTLFSNLVDLHSLDNRFDYLSSEQRALVERFWGTFERTGAATSTEQADFLRIWRTLGPVYHRFRGRLRELGIAYQGMVYREAAERILRDEAPQIPQRHYVIAGFNALSRSEQTVFEYLQKTFRTDFYWDFDNYFLLDPSQEAGRFMRDNLRRFPPASQLSGGHDNFIKPKHIRSVSSASDVLQCKWAGTTLADLTCSRPLDKNTAVVLCDEGLLTPLLWSLPPQVQSVNITMGYPLRLHPDYTAMERRLVELLRRHRDKDWHTISNGLLDQTQDLLDDFDNAPASNTAAAPAESLEYSGFQSIISDHICALTASLDTLDIAISPRTFATLLRRSLQSIRVPFEGEPLEGVQIMGILETRALDFETIIFLSAGDGTMPGNLVGAPSFIPYSLKMAYGLPTPEHHEGVWAYHFFRLISRATNIDLVWSSTSDERTVGEPSRYIRQLDYESPHFVEHHSVTVDVNLSPSAPIVVPKQIERLPRRLSPSLFSTYVDCPLKFYFRAVAGLRAEEEPAEEVDNALLGNILHLAMHRLYLPLANTPNPQSQIRSLIGSGAIDAAVTGAISELFSSEAAGSIALVHKTITGYINHRILPFDAAQDEPFIIEKLEEWIEAPFEFSPPIGLAEIPPAGSPTAPSVASTIAPPAETAAVPHTVTFFGKVDRIDRLSDNTLRIVDYKTGSPHNRQAAELQIALYALMLRNATPDKNAEARPTPNIQTSLYYVRLLPETIASDGIEPDTEQRLRDTLRELFDPSIPFSQCSDPAPCSWCDFNAICRR